MKLSEDEKFLLTRTRIHCPPGFQLLHPEIPKDLSFSDAMRFQARNLPRPIVNPRFYRGQQVVEVDAYNSPRVKRLGRIKEIIKPKYNSDEINSKYLVDWEDGHFKEEGVWAQTLGFYKDWQLRVLSYSELHKNDKLQSAKMIWSRYTT